MSAFMRSTQVTNSAEVGRPFRFDDAVDLDSGHLLLDRGLLSTAGQNVNLDAETDQGFGEFPHMAGQPALDQRRVLPGDDENARSRSWFGG